MSYHTRHILVVDDNTSIHDDFRKIFAGLAPDSSQLDQLTAQLFGSTPVRQKPTCHLDFASQGQEALEMVRSAIINRQPYSMAFLDVQMPPGWDGVQTLREIWKIAPDLHVVICTAFSNYSIEEIQNLGRTDQIVVLKKPFDAIEVLQMANVFSEKWQLLNELKERARKLEESQHRYRFLAEATPGLLWTATAGGNVDYVNQRWTDYTGISAEGSKDWSWQTAVHPDDLPSCIARWARALQSGENFEVEYRLRRADGVYRWHLGRARAMRNEQGDILHWVGTCTDVDDKKRAENVLIESNASLEKRVAERTLELTKSEARYRELINGQAEGVVYSDVDSKFTFANPAAESILGVWSGQLVGKTLYDFLDEQNKAIAKEQRELRKAGKKSSYEIEVTTPRGERRQLLITCAPQVGADGTISGTFAIYRDITQRKAAERAVRESQRLMRAVLDNIPDAVARVDRDFRFTYGNRAMAADIRKDSFEFLGKTGVELGMPFHDRWNEELRHVFETGTPRAFEFQWHGPDGIYYREARLVPEFSSTGEVEFVLAVTRNVTEQKKLQQESQLMDLQLRQAQKMEAVGQLAAGIAHEINTPTQYVGDNTQFLKQAFTDLTTALKDYTHLIAAAKQNAVTPELIAHAEQVLAACDLDYHIEQIPAAINETLEGVERVSKIVRAMKEFSYPGGKEKSATDINKAIDSTTTVARNEWKYVAELVLDLDPNLPAVPCFISEFNQAILNLVVNAAHAIRDAIRDQKGKKGVITVRTRRDGDCAEVRVSDTGTGIPEAHRQRIFEPFFTTKAVGKGTGQGLTVVYGSIVKKHGGTVTFETEIGKGTTFILHLPLGANTSDKVFLSPPNPLRNANLSQPVGPL
jgi:PAS domain S-box-containing protein